MQESGTTPYAQCRRRPILWIGAALVFLGVVLSLISAEVVRMRDQAKQMNRPPVAQLTGPARKLDVGVSLELDASASHDPDGDSLKFFWDLNGDGTYERDSGTDSVLSIEYWDTLENAGYRPGAEVTVGLKVVDDHGAAGYATVLVKMKGQADQHPQWGVLTGCIALVATALVLVFSHRVQQRLSSVLFSRPAETDKRRRWLILWLCASVISLGLALALATVVADAVRTHRLTYETFVHLFGCVSHAEAANGQDLSKIYHYLGILQHHDIEPPSEFRKLFTTELVALYRNDGGFYWPLPTNVLAGVDRFGTPYIYEVSFRGRSEDSDADAYTNTYEITVRSAGANRRDDGGDAHSDDCECNIDIGIYHRR